MPRRRIPGRVVPRTPPELSRGLVALLREQNVLRRQIRKVGRLDVVGGPALLDDPVAGVGREDPTQSGTPLGEILAKKSPGPGAPVSEIVQRVMRERRLATINYVLEEISNRFPWGLLDMFFRSNSDETIIEAWITLKGIFDAVESDLATRESYKALLNARKSPFKRTLAEWALDFPRVGLRDNNRPRPAKERVDRVLKSVASALVQETLFSTTESGSGRVKATQLIIADLMDLDPKTVQKIVDSNACSVFDNHLERPPSRLMRDLLARAKRSAGTSRKALKRRTKTKTTNVKKKDGGK